MTKSAATQNDTATVGAQLIAPEAFATVEWQEYKLGDIAEVKGGKRLPKGELLVDYETPHPYVRVTDMGNKWIRKSGLQFVTPEVQKKIVRYTVNSGDVILSIVGSIGFVGRISKELNGANLTENCVKFLSNHRLVDDDFLFYYLKSNIGQEEIKKRNVGSTQPKLPLYNIKDINILLPILAEQKAIAAVLSSLDDKIDLLHRQNQTLEAMAQTLFRQWFIEEAREDWETKKIKDLVEIQSGFAFKSSTFSDVGKYKLITIKAVQDGYLDITNADEIDFIADKVPSYCILVKNDILLSLTGNVGRCCLVDRTNLLLNQRVAKLKPIEDSNWAFTYILFRQTAMKQNLEDLSKGSAQANLSPIETGLIEIVVPKDDFFIKFSAEVTPLMLKVMSNKIQIQTLTQLRDTLLPKLMSGEIRVEVEYE